MLKTRAEAKNSKIWKSWKFIKFKISHHKFRQKFWKQKIAVKTTNDGSVQKQQNANKF